MREPRAAETQVGGRLVILAAVLAGGCKDERGPTVVNPIPPEPVFVETRKPPGDAPDGLVLRGTVWESPDVMTPDDPSALDSIVYAGRGMRRFYDRSIQGWRDDLDLFLFAAHFEGDTVLQVEAHPAYGIVDSARVFVDMFVPSMGPLPRFLIDHAREVEIMPQVPEKPSALGAGGLGCQKSYHWRGDVRGEWQEPFLEEVAMHEGSHAVLEGCCHGETCAELGGARSDEWRAAQAADSMFITDYARNYPEREDMAETLWAWFVSRCVSDRLHPEYKRRIDEGIPHRLVYFDSLNLDMRPWRC